MGSQTQSFWGRIARTLRHAGHLGLTCVLLHALSLSSLAAAQATIQGPDPQELIDLCYCLDNTPHERRDRDPVLGGCNVHSSLPPTGPRHASTAFVSSCWHGFAYTNTGQANGPDPACLANFIGNPTHYDPLYGLAAGTYPPKSVDPVDGTYPLVARAVDYVSSPSAHAQRQVLGQSLDLLTGKPLLRDIDFELPFAGGSYRFVRTYSEVSDQNGGRDGGHMNSGTAGPLEPVPASHLYWDWVGQGWMLGDNPLFLIDATYEHHDPPADPNNPGTGLKTRCFFMPDAHRSIPFVRINEYPGPPSYVAPPHLDAILTYDGGQWDATARAWIERPTAWHVWLQNRSIKYTIAPVYEDMPVDEAGNSLNLPPHTFSNQNQEYYGRPYIGLTTQIEDRFGNQIRISYCDQMRTDDPENIPPVDPGPCFPCRQDCMAKGQISHVELVDSEGTVQWTLLHVYRRFGVTTVVDPTPPIPATPWDQHFSKLQSIYVYEGPLASGVLGQCRQLSAELWHDISEDWEAYTGSDRTNFAPYHMQLMRNVDPELHYADDLDPVNDLPTNWTHRVRYLYADGTPLMTEADGLGLEHWFNSVTGLNYGAPYLLQSTVTMRDDSGEESESHRIYRYESLGTNGGATSPIRLHCIFGSANIQKLASEIPPLTEPTTGFDEDASEWPEKLHVLEEFETIDPVDGALLKAHKVLDYADQVFASWGTPHGGRFANLCYSASGLPFARSHMHEEMVSRYMPGINLADSRPVALDGGAAVYADRMYGGGGRTYRMYRFMVLPRSVIRAADEERSDCTAMHSNVSTTGGVPLSFDDNGTGLSIAEWRDRTRFDGEMGVNPGGGALPGIASVDNSVSIEPYRYHTDIGGYAEYVPSAGDPFWVTVIDEYEQFDYASAEWGRTTPLRYPGWPTEEKVGICALGGWQPNANDLPTWPSLSSLAGSNATAKQLASLPISRRVVQMNAAGHVLAAFEFDPATATLTDAEGMWEEFAYDWNPPTDYPDTFNKPIGRLLEHRTFGWSAAKVQAGGSDPSEGLVYVYRYDPSSDEDMNVVAEGLKWGTAAGAPTKWVRQYLRHPERADIVMHTIEYPEGKDTADLYPIGTALSASDLAALDDTVRVTTDAVALVPAPGNNADVQTYNIERRAVIKPPAREAPGGPLLFPVEATRVTQPSNGADFEDTWRGRGATSELVSLLTTNNGAVEFTGLQSSSFETLHIDFERRDQFGRLRLQISDAPDDIPAALPGWTYSRTVSDPPERPAGWTRVDMQTQPLNDWTDLRQTRSHGPRAIYEHTGRVQLTKVRKLPAPAGEPRITEHRIYKQLTFDMGNGSHDGTPLAPGEIIRFRDGEQIERLEVKWAVPVPQNPGGTEAYEVIRTLGLERDSAGRVSKATVSADAESVSQTVEYDRIGGISRARHANGMIERTLRDERGRIVAKYHGSRDRHVFWGTASPADVSTQDDDDMALIERRFYGEGVRDADRVIELRSFRLPPPNQYPTFDGDGYPTNPASTDQHGWPTRFGYNWAGQAVRTSNFMSGALHLGAADTDSSPADGRGDGIATSHHFAFSSLNGEQRLSASFAEQAPASWEEDLYPTSAPGDALPTAVEVLQLSGAGIRLTGLTERVYNQRGRVVEARNYDPGDPAGASLVTRSYYDHEDRLTYRDGPGADEEYVYDAKGRQIELRRWAGGVVVAMVQSVFDELGHEVETHRWERRHDAAPSPATVDLTNAIRTTTYRWYDLNSNIIATADLGTSDATSFVNGVLPPRPAIAPTWDLSGQNPVLVQDPLQSLPAHARITTTEYDETANVVAEMDPVGVRTEYDYSKLGKMILQVENALDPDASKRRATAYRYEDGQLVAMARVLDPTILADPFEAHIPWGDMDPTRIQETQLAIGATSPAPVVSAEPDPTDGSSLSIHGQNSSFVHGIRLPRRSVNDPIPIPGGGELQFQLSYYPDGLVATEADPRGVIFKHYYNEQAQRVETLIDRTNATPHLFEEPHDQVTRTVFEYDEATGRLMKATAYWSNPANGLDEIVAESVLEYDSRGNLIAEYQARGEAVDLATTPKVEYDRQFDVTNQVDRLTAIRYPVSLANHHQRVVTMQYGAPGSIDDDLSRVAHIHDGAFGRIASFTRTGTGRRLAFDRIDDMGTPDPLDDTSRVRWSAIDSMTGDYAGLSTFGEVADRHWKNDLGQTTMRYQYVRDERGLISAAQITQRDFATLSHDNQRSQKFGYDTLRQLTEFEMGAYDATTHAISASTLLPVPRTQNWDLATDGNWNEMTTVDSSGATSVGQQVNGRNELESFDDPNITPTNLVYHDAAGNTMLDEDYFYQYDGFGRLVQISERGGVAVDAQGVWSGTPGDTIVHFTYDPFGRLIRRQAPHPGSSNGVRSEHYYYDGVRRIQELFSDPITTASPPTGGAGVGGGVGIGSEGEAGEAGTLDTGGATVPPGTGPPTPIDIGDQWIDREYIYTPGYVDEFIVQIDRNGDPLFVLHDETGSVVGLVNGAGELVRQYTWDPYGTLLFTELHASHAYNRIGHKGLFAERLNVNTLQPTLTAGAVGLYHNRNRSYLPEYGRFLQRDPNGLGLPVLEDMAMHGSTLGASSLSIDLESHLGDGTNAFAYLASDPIGNTDPTGLFLSLLGPTQGLDVYADYNDEILATGLDGHGILSSLLDDYGFGQLDAIDAILNWDDVSLAGLSVGGAIPQKTESHHVIAKFMRGVDRRANRLELPQSLHKEYHRILRDKFKKHKLNSPHSRGSKKWVRRFDSGQVSTEEVNRVRRALMDAAREFDEEVSPEYNVAGKTRASLKGRLYKGGALDVGKTLRKRRGRH